MGRKELIENCGSYLWDYKRKGQGMILFQQSFRTQHLQKVLLEYVCIYSSNPEQRLRSQQRGDRHSSPISRKCLQRKCRCSPHDDTPWQNKENRHMAFQGKLCQRLWEWTVACPENWWHSPYWTWTISFTGPWIICFQQKVGSGPEIPSNASFFFFFFNCKIAVWTSCAPSCYLKEKEEADPFR